MDSSNAQKEHDLESTGVPSPSSKVAADSPSPAIVDAEPMTVEVLRRKLDSAIMAEAWDAVKAIRERIIRAEREEAGNVVDLAREHARRPAK